MALILMYSPLQNRHFARHKLIFAIIRHFVVVSRKQMEAHKSKQGEQEKERFSIFFLLKKNDETHRVLSFSRQ